MPRWPGICPKSPGIFKARRPSFFPSRQFWRSMTKPIVGPIVGPILEPTVVIKAWEYSDHLAREHSKLKFPCSKRGALGRLHNIA